MSKYCILQQLYCRQTIEREYRIEADSEEEAISIALSGNVEADSEEELKSYITDSDVVSVTEL